MGEQIRIGQFRALEMENERESERDGEREERKGGFASERETTGCACERRAPNRRKS